MAVKYTIMHVPTGILWNECLLFDKKSQGVAWLNSIPLNKDKTINTDAMRIAFRYSPKEKLERKFRTIERNKLFILGSLLDTSNKKSLSIRDIKEPLEGISIEEFIVMAVTIDINKIVAEEQKNEEILY